MNKDKYLYLDSELKSLILGLTCILDIFMHKATGMTNINLFTRIIDIIPRRKKKKK